MAGVLVGYMITVYDVLRNENITRMVCGTTNSTELSELFPYTEHLVYISGFTKGGTGNTSLVTSFFTLEAGKNMIMINTYPNTPHYTTIHYTTTLHYTTIHYTTLHRTSLYSNTLHYTLTHFTTSTITNNTHTIVCSLSCSR